MDEASRNLAWKLNWYRQSELDGALLLGRMVRVAQDGYLIGKLTHHCADEARHSDLWARCIGSLGLPFLRIHRSYQSFFLEHGGTPTGLTEVLAFTQIFERRVHKRFSDELDQPGLPPVLRETFETMIRDEKDHLEWVFTWLKGRAEAPALLNKYIAIDDELYHRLLPLFDRLWEVPGLGEPLLSSTL